MGKACVQCAKEMTVLDQKKRGQMKDLVARHQSAGHNAGLVTRYEVFHLPALFLVKDGHFFGALHTRLTHSDLVTALGETLLRPAEELP